MVDQVIERVDREPGDDPRAKLRRLFSLASNRKRPGAGNAPASDRKRPGADNDPGAPNPMKIELAIRDWARRDRAVATRLAHVDNRRMEYMRKLFTDICSDPEDVEVRCLLAFSIFIGSHFIAADHGTYDRSEIVQLALERLLA